MKRVQLQLPDAVVAWMDAQTDGIESRASFLRRTIVGLMKAEQRHQQASDQARDMATGGVRHCASQHSTGGLEEA